MPQPTIVTQDSRRLIDGSISRRVLLAGSTGLVAATGLAVHNALAQGTPTPGMPAVQAPVRQEWLLKRHEEIIEPELPIIDPHHHLWDRPNYRYLFPELLGDVGSGHNIRATCYEHTREMSSAFKTPRDWRIRPATFRFSRSWVWVSCRSPTIPRS